MQPESHYLKMSDGTLIYYEKYGEGLPLILLHGNGGHGGYFSRQIQPFAAYFTVYLMDSRGHGKSTNASDTLNFHLMALDILELMVHENLANVHLLGFSDGANLALVFATLYPLKVRSLILNAGNTLVSGVKWWANATTFMQYEWFKSLAFCNRKYEKKCQLLQLMMIDTGVLDSQLQQITCPVLILVGSRDVVKLSHSKYLARNIKGSTFLRIPGETHFYAKRNPVSFNQQVLQFFKETHVINWKKREEGSVVK